MVPGPEKDQRRRTDRLGDVGRPRIVGKSPPAQSEEPLEGSPGKLGPEMDPGWKRPAGGGEGFLLRPVGRPSETKDVEAFVAKASGDGRKAIRRPVFRPGPGAAEKDPVFSLRDPLFREDLAGVGQVSVGEREARRMGTFEPPESADEVRNPVPGQGELDRRRDGLRVDEAVDSAMNPGTLVHQSQAAGGPGKKGDDPGAGTAGEEVDHEVVPLRADFPKKTEIPQKFFRAGTRFGGKGKGPFEIRLLPQQGVEGRSGQIVDFGFRVKASQSGKGPRRKDDIPQAPKADQENLPDRSGRSAFQGRPSPAVVRGRASSTSITGMSSFTG